MNRKRITAMIAVLAMGASTWSLAADHDPKAERGMHGMQGMPSMQGGMMSGCPMMGDGMRGSGMGSVGMMLQLAPSNEKLQLDMWGEMIQKMSEIASKYGAQVK